MRVVAPKLTPKAQPANAQAKREKSRYGLSCDAVASPASEFIDGGREATEKVHLQSIMDRSPNVYRSACLQTKTDTSPCVMAQVDLRAMINNSTRQAVQREQLEHMFGPSVERQERLEETELQIDSEPVRMVERSGKGGAGADTLVQRREGQRGLPNIEEALFKGTTTGGKKVASDIYKKNPGPASDGDFTEGTVEKIKIHAEAMGYATEAATRLATKQPYTKEELKNGSNDNVATLPSDEPKIEREAIKVPVQTFTLPHFTIGERTTPNRHNTRFENTYSTGGEVIMGFNSRNPCLAEFFASDVVERQKEVANATIGEYRDDIENIESYEHSEEIGDLKEIVREHVVSKTGQEWMEGVKDRQGGEIPFDQYLDEGDLEEFMNETDNGKSTKNTIRGRYVVVRGRVERYGDESDDAWSVRLYLRKVEQAPLGGSSGSKGLPE